MKLLIAVISFAVTSSSVATSSDGEACATFIKKSGNYKVAQQNPQCLRAADAGDSAAQYSVGMGYGFAGRPDLEEKYYRLAAAQGLAPAYLALGHSLLEAHEDEAIQWYERFVETRADGYGYGSKLLADIFERRGDQQQSRYWLSVCKASSYQGC